MGYITNFMALVQETIDKFIGEILGTPAARCLLDLLSPVMNLVSLALCPLDEGVAGVIMLVVDQVLAASEDIIDKASEQVITAGVDALIPDNFSVEIPDFRQNFPDPLNTAIEYVELATCVAAKFKWPTHQNRMNQVTTFTLPYKITGKMIEGWIINKAVAATRVAKIRSSYQSVCVEAYKKV